MKDNLNVIIDEHQKIYSLVKPLVDAALRKDAITLYAEIERVSKKLPGLIMSHFLLEENIIYPALVLNNNAADLIDEMLLIQKEHGMLEQQMKQVLHFMKRIDQKNYNESPILQELLIETVIDFYENVKEHQANEDKLFRSFGVE